MTTGARGCRARARKLPSRQNRRRGIRYKPTAPPPKNAWKQRPCASGWRKPNSKSRSSRASSASSMSRLPTARCSRANRHAQPSFPRRARKWSQGWQKRKRNGWRRVARWKPRELIELAVVRRGGGFWLDRFLGVALFRRRLGRGRRHGRAVDFAPATIAESVDTWPRSGEISEHD